ncbi:MAG: hypothetical protein HDQ88_10095, partial [Clostridia bacterium]|nr:hypothetical protein [Clostridia bacterium]
IGQSDFDKIVKQYENDTYARMEYKSRSVSDIRVLTEQRRRNEINDSTWILGILGYKKAIVTNTSSPYKLPTINPNDTTLSGPQEVASLYKTGDIPLHAAVTYINEYRASWEASLPSNVLSEPTRDIHDVENALNNFKDGTIPFSKMLVELKAFITPNTKVTEIKEDPEKDPVLMVGDKVKISQESLREEGQSLSELDSYYTVIGGDRVQPNYKMMEEVEENNSGIMLLDDDPPDDSYGGYAPPPSQATTGEKDPAFNGKEVGVVDSAGNTAAVPLSSVNNAVTGTVVGRSIETSGKLNIADLPISSVVSITKDLVAGAQDVKDGKSSIGDLVRQANSLIKDETIASVEAGTFRGEVDYQQNSLTVDKNEEDSINDAEGYTTLPGATNWTTGQPVTGSLSVIIGSQPVKLFSQSDAPTLGLRKYSYQELVDAAHRLTSGDPTMNLTLLVQMAKAYQSYEPDVLEESARLNERNLESDISLNKQMPVTSPSSVHDKNLQGGTRYSSGSARRDDGVAYRPDEEQLVMGNVKYHQIYKTDDNFNYIGTTGRQAYNRKVMLDQDKDLIKNKHGYPFQPGTRTKDKDDNTNYLINHKHHEFDTDGDGTIDYLYLERGLLPNQYEYMTNPQVDITDRFNHEQTPDERPDVFNGSFIQNLTTVRAALGIPVHGDLDHAIAMKYFMYNRFRIPDNNLAFNKSVPHIFFTRPDLNLLKSAGGNEFTIRDALQHNAEVTMLWRQRPEMFKLLTDRTRCGDKDNFNYLLSNQVVELHSSDEEIDIQDAGKSWGGYSIPYGGVFTGRNSGKLEITFNETQYGDVTKFLKLWMIYIDNVSRGVWSPSYNLFNTNAHLTSGYSYVNGQLYDSRGNKVNDMGQFNVGDGWSPDYFNSHVYTRTLDYAASIYTFRLGPDGDEVIYWTKYYGVFPINGGNSAMGSFNGNQDISSALPITATFSYAWKKDMSPMSLLEFNDCANAMSDGDIDWEWVWSPYTQRAGRPFVTKPFIYFDMVKNVTVPGQNEARLGKKRMRINLRFENKPNEKTMGDNILYKSLV